MISMLACIVHMYIYIYIHRYTRRYVCMYTRERERDPYLRICVYIDMYIYIYIYAHKYVCWNIPQNPFPHGLHLVAASKDILQPTGSRTPAQTSDLVDIWLTKGEGVQVGQVPKFEARAC